MDRTGALKAFASLASGARLDIFCQLVRAGPEGLVAGDIARVLGTPANNVSFHLKTMRTARLVNAVQEGRFLRYLNAQERPLTDVPRIGLSLGGRTLNAVIDSGSTGMCSLA